MHLGVSSCRLCTAELCKEDAWRDMRLFQCADLDGCDRQPGGPWWQHHLASDQPGQEPHCTARKAAPGDGAETTGERVPLGDAKRAHAFPLVLATGAKPECYVHSQLRHMPSLRQRMPHNPVEIHPDTAADCGVVAGDTVVIESPRGSVTCQVSLTDTIRPRVAQLFHRFSGANANRLTDNGPIDPMTGAAPLRLSLCRIQKA